MRKLIFFASIALGCIFCWCIGLVNPMFGYLFTGAMMVLCPVVIALAEPSQQPPAQTTLPAPIRYRVVEDDVLILPVARGRLEVGR